MGENTHSERLWPMTGPRDGDLKVQTSGQGTWHVWTWAEGDWRPHRSHIGHGTLARLLDPYWCYQQQGVYDGFYRMRPPAPPPAQPLIGANVTAQVQALLADPGP